MTSKGGFGSSPVRCELGMGPFSGLTSPILCYLWPARGEFSFVIEPGSTKGLRRSEAHLRSCIDSLGQCMVTM